MQQGNVRRDERRARTATAMLSKLREGTVIVEGKHDIPKLEALGISVITYGKAVSDSGAADPRKTVYLLTDDDKGGEEKKGKLISALLERDKSFVINTELGAHILKLLNIRSFEQMGKPMAELLAKVEEKQKGEYNGENIFGHSKVHGNG